MDALKLGVLFWLLYIVAVICFLACLLWQVFAWLALGTRMLVERLNNKLGNPTRNGDFSKMSPQELIVSLFKPSDEGEKPPEITQPLRNTESE